MSNIVLKIIQLSDLHISQHRNLLEPMVDQINKEEVDLVIVTGDLVNKPEKELFEIAKTTLNKITHKVLVTPGDYDGGGGWDKYFDRYQHLSISGYNIDILDTSFIRHRFNVGWGDALKSEDIKQYDWLVDKLKLDSYHLIFSHHPFLVNPKEKNEFFRDNLRAAYSGHLRDVYKFYFKYDNPKSSFSHGFSATGLKFHGNSCYLIIMVDSNGEIANVPRMINTKRTAWS